MEETFPTAFQWFTGLLNIFFHMGFFIFYFLSRLDENLRAKCPPQFLADPERVKKAVERVNNIGPKK